MKGARGHKRGKTTCEHLREKSKEERAIQFKDDGTPISKYHSGFSTYYGVLVRERVSCTYENWKKVHVAIKNDMWNEIKVKIKNI